MKTRDIQCLSGKRTFKNESDAKRAAYLGMLERDIVLNYYFCLQCYDYHLTSKEKESFKKNFKRRK